MRIARVSWRIELYPRVGFIVTNLSRPPENIVAFYNMRGTCEQWIKEGKGAIQWTRLSCRLFSANAVRLPNYIEHQDYRHILGVIANRVGEWTTLGNFAHWCFPIPLIAGPTGRPEFDACLLLKFNIVRPLRWLGLMEEADAPHWTPIEQRRIRKTALFDQFLHFADYSSPKVYH